MVSFFRPPVVDVETLALQVGTPHLAEQFGTSSNKIFALFRNTDSTVFFFLRRASWRRAWKFSLAFPVRSRTRYRPNESQGDFPRMAEKNDGKIRITNAHKSRSVDDDVFFLAIFSFFSNTNAKNAETDVATQNRNPNWRTTDCDDRTDFFDRKSIFRGFGRYANRAIGSTKGWLVQFWTRENFLDDSPLQNGSDFILKIKTTVKTKKIFKLARSKTDFYKK